MSEVSTEWHRSEPRVVRPFFSARAAEEAIHGTTIRLFEGSQPSGETAFDIDEIDLRKLAIVVNPALAVVTSWLPEGYKPKDFNVVVMARNSLIKRSIVLFNEPASTFKGDPVELLPEQLEDLGAGRNLRLTVALCLNADRKPATGAPFIIGHWLSSKTFTIKEKKLPALFDVQPRTNEQWVEKGYPARTLYCVEYTSGIADEPSADESGNIATVFVHVDAYNRMVGGDRLGEALQPVLLAEIVAQILEQSRSDWENLSEIAKGSPLETFVKELKGTDLASLDGLKKSLKEPNKMRAVIQAKWNVLSAVTSG